MRDSVREYGVCSRPSLNTPSLLVKRNNHPPLLFSVKARKD